MNSLYYNLSKWSLAWVNLIAVISREITSFLQALVILLPILILFYAFFQFARASFMSPDPLSIQIVTKISSFLEENHPNAVMDVKKPKYKWSRAELIFKNLQGEPVQELKLRLKKVKTITVGGKRYDASLIDAIASKKAIDRSRSLKSFYNVNVEFTLASRKYLNFTSATISISWNRLDDTILEGQMFKKLNKESDEKIFIYTTHPQLARNVFDSLVKLKIVERIETLNWLYLHFDHEIISGWCQFNVDEKSLLENKFLDDFKQLINLMYLLK